MSRVPLTSSKMYAWHRAALAHVAKHGTLKGFNGPIKMIADEPQCGWFKRKFVRDGQFVAARIFYEQPIDDETGELIGDEVMRCEVDGRRRDPIEEWTYLASHPISQEEFLTMTSASFTPSEPAMTTGSTNLPF